MKATTHGAVRCARKLLAASTILFVALLAALFFSGTAFAASSKVISNDATGGDCTTIGTWNSTTKTCTLTTDVIAPAGSNGIEVINDGITLDGNGHSVTGAGGGFSTGGSLSVRSNVVIRNLTISQFAYGIYLLSSNRNTVHDNTFSGNTYGIYLSSSSNNGIYNNNFIGNTTSAYVSGGAGNFFDVPASGGNYWDNYSLPSQGCDDNNGDFVCDAVYMFTGAQDNIPWRVQDGWKVSPPPDTTPPVIGSVLPSGTIDSSSATIAVSYSDAGSNVNLSSVVVTLDGSALSGCTVTQAGASCPVTGLATGPHTIGGSVTDNRGNTSTFSGGFTFVDSTAPVVSNVLPSGITSSTSATLSANYSDGAGSGIAVPSVAVLLDGSAVSGCSAGASGVTCPVSGLADGNHSITVSVSDNSANTGSASGSFLVDSTAPSVGPVLPSGTVSSNSTDVSAGYADSGSGINTASVSLMLDGAAMSGCTVTATGISCPASGLATGPHTIGGSVSDNAGNTTTISGSFSFIDNTPPALSNLSPTGTISTSSTTLSANYSDGSGSGVNAASVAVTLDGNPVSGCAVTAGSVSCAVSGIADGAHTYGISVDDYAGNHGTGTAAFQVDTTGPVITPTMRISATGTGGDCTLIGIWDAATKTCTLTGDYNFGTHNGIEIAADGITLDGNGHTITGGGGYNTGGSLSVRNNVTVRNLTVRQFNYGIYLMASNGNTVRGNTFIGDSYGVYMTSSSNNRIYNNNFSGNATQMYVSGGSGNQFDQAAPTGGNWWSDYDTPAEGCNDTNADGFCDAPHAFTGGADNLPLVNPLSPPADITPPNVTAVQPSGTVNSDATTISVSYYDVGTGIDTSSVTVRLDGAALAGCTVTATSAGCPVTGLAAGAHTISGSVADLSGNVSQINGGFTVVINSDTTAPVISSILPAGTITATSATISAYYSDGGSGVNAASVAVTLDGSAVSGCSAGASTVSCPVSGLAQGTHTIGVSVSDNAGNTGAASGSFTVDSAGPVVSSISPAGWVNSSTVTVSADLSDATSGVDPASVQVTVGQPLPGAALTGCSVTQTHVACAVSGLYDYGNTNIYINLRDNAGNSGSGNGTFGVDTTAPAITQIQPAGIIDTTSATLSVYIDDTLSGVNESTGVISLDGTPVAGCNVTRGPNSCPVSGLTEGTHTIGVSVSDNAGNTGMATGSFTVSLPAGDTTAPVISDILPAGTITTTSATVSAYYTDAGSGVDAASVAVYLDGAAMSGCTVTASSASCPAAGLAEGSHAISVSAADNAGNTGSGSGSFMVDTLAPSVGGLTPTGAIASPVTTISATYSDPGSGIDSASAAVYIENASVDSCTATDTGISCQISGMADGRHDFTVSVRDLAGNIGSASDYLLVDTVNPAVTDLQPSGTITTTSATVSAYYSDSGSGLNWSTAAATLDGVTLTDCTRTSSNISCPVTGLTEGVHNVEVSVLDNITNRGTATGSFTVALPAKDTTAPIVEGIQPSGTITKRSATVSAYYSDAESGIDASTVAVSIDGIRLQISNCTVTDSQVTCMAGNLLNGTHSINISVSDNAGNTGTGTASFTVNLGAYDLARGSAVYHTNCAFCHGDDGRTDAIAGHTVSDIEQTTRNGRSDMPAFDETMISDAELHDMSDYVSNALARTDNTAPLADTIWPQGTVASHGAAIEVYFSDAGGWQTKPAAVVVKLDSETLTACSVDYYSAVCDVYGLANGDHSVTATLVDYAGNSAIRSGTFTVSAAGGETVAPTVGDVTPTGTINTASTAIGASFSDNTGGSGINPASAAVSLDGTVISGCTASATGVSCPVGGLAQGAHNISVSVSDNDGNPATGAGSFTVDSVAPVVSNIQPSGTVTTTGVTLSAGYSDSGSGIDSATAAVYLDGNRVSGCTVDSASVSCAVTGLASGPHAITVSVKDNAGNTGTGTGSFTVTPPAPPPCTFVDSNNATIAVFSNSSYTTQVCQGDTLSPNTTYYVQITHPNMNLNNEGKRTAQMKLFNMKHTQLSFGNGSSSVPLTQQAGGPPYSYRGSFVTPGAAEVYSLEPELQNNPQTKYFYPRGWSLRVGNTASYVRTFSDAGYSVQTDTFAPGSTVYVEFYSSLLTAGTPAASKSSVYVRTFMNSTATIAPTAVSSPSSKRFRVQFTLPAGAGDRSIQILLRNSSSTTLGYPDILIHVR